MCDLKIIYVSRASISYFLEKIRVKISLESSYHNEQIIVFFNRLLPIENVSIDHR